MRDDSKGGGEIPLCAGEVCEYNDNGSCSISEPPCSIAIYSPRCRRVISSLHTGSVVVGIGPPFTSLPT